MFLFLVTNKLSITQTHRCVALIRFDSVFFLYHCRMSFIYILANTRIYSTHNWNWELRNVDRKKKQMISLEQVIYIYFLTLITNGLRQYTHKKCLYTLIALLLSTFYCMHDGDLFSSLFRFWAVTKLWMYPIQFMVETICVTKFELLLIHHRAHTDIKETEIHNN